MSKKTMKITTKGQITIPKEIRDFLKTNMVSFDVVEGVVIIKPIRDAGGSLSKYAANAKEVKPFREMKQEAWEEAVREKISSEKSSPPPLFL